jgi:plasmid stabilization system protein ParE
VAEVVLLLSAEADALAIYANLDERQPGRGELFSIAFESLRDLLREFPRLGRPFAEPFHRLKMSRFPYALFYEVAGNRIIVHAILSDFESPSYIRRRLGL